MNFAEIRLPQTTLAAFALPDIPYEVPKVYFDHIGVDPETPPLAAMLFALQKRAAHEKADWLKLAPAMDALVHALLNDGSPSMTIIDRPDLRSCWIRSIWMGM